MDALSHELGAVRSNAALALGKIGDARAMEKLTVVTKDPFVDARTNAAWALDQLKN
jgi:HEAT repeat protein